MTQAQDIPTWCVHFQFKLAAALDAIWKSIETSSDPAALREARDKARAIGDIAAMARKVALVNPAGRPKPPRDPLTAAVTSGLAATQGVANLSAMVMDSQLAAAAPVAAQAEHARRALDKLKGGRRGRL